MNQNLKGYLSVILTTFVSSVLAYVSTALAQGFTPTMQWQAVLFAALTTGLASVWHLFQAAPGSNAPKLDISAIVAAVLAEIEKKPAVVNVTNVTTTPTVSQETK